MVQSTLARPPTSDASTLSPIHLCTARCSLSISLRLKRLPLLTNWASSMMPRPSSNSACLPAILCRYWLSNVPMATRCRGYTGNHFLCIPRRYRSGIRTRLSQRDVCYVCFFVVPKLLWTVPFTGPWKKREKCPTSWQTCLWTNLQILT
jgi:hypothetical protein